VKEAVTREVSAKEAAVDAEEDGARCPFA